MNTEVNHGGRGGWARPHPRPDAGRATAKQHRTASRPSSWPEAAGHRHYKPGPSRAPPGRPGPLAEGLLGFKPRVGLTLLAVSTLGWAWWAGGRAEGHGSPQQTDLPAAAGQGRAACPTRLPARWSSPPPRDPSPCLSAHQGQRGAGSPASTQPRAARKSPTPASHLPAPWPHHR